MLLGSAKTRKIVQACIHMYILVLPPLYSVVCVLHKCIELTAWDSTVNSGAKESS
jgi:hypothetical protein